MSLSRRIALALFCFVAYYWKENHEKSGELFFFLGIAILVISVLLVFILHFETKVQNQSIILDGLWTSRKIKIDLSSIRPMVATPGDPTNGCLIEKNYNIPIDIAYGGSCTGGKFDDIEFYAKVVKHALNNNLKVKKNVKFFIQFSTQSVRKMAHQNGYNNLFKKANIKLIEPGCGACIGCGPGISENKNQISISAINRNFQGRSGPGKLYLASPLTVAASAFAGKIVSFQ